MIGIEIQGRLGNQMFQYAFGIGAAHKLNTLFFLNYFHYPILIDEYFELPGYNKYLNKILNKIFPLRKSHFDNIEENKASSPQDFVKSLADKSLYKGYFQTDFFFKGISDRVKAEFRVKKKYKLHYEKHFNDVVAGNQKLLIIHYRGTDYKTSDFELPFSYYQKCLSLLSLSDFKTIVVTDDLEKAKLVFQDYKDFSFQHNESIIDFQFILTADVAIISNSSFAWWAGYLNEKKDKKIYAPKYWFGFKEKQETPKGIMNDEFLWIEVQISM